jgi:hypothetical protein
VKTGAWVKRMLQGHLNYFAVSGNDPSLWCFFNEVRTVASFAPAAQPGGVPQQFIRRVDRFLRQTLHGVLLSRGIDEAKARADEHIATLIRSVPKA